MAKKTVSARAFVNATLKTTARLRFVDLDTGDATEDDFVIEYFALSPKKADELATWSEEFDKRVDAFNARLRAHAESEAQRRLKHEAAEAEREEAARAAGETFVSEPFKERPFEDPEEAELKHALAHVVSRMLASIPEIVEEVDGQERPMPITPETLAGFDQRNLLAIRDAIDADTKAGPTKPASSPSS